MANVRPWQGTALGVVDIISAVFSFLGGGLFLLAQGLMMGFMGAADEVTAEGAGAFAMFAGMGIIAGVVLIALGVLSIFMARGSFKGQKWSVIVAMVLSALGILSSLATFGGGMIFNLAINGFVLYLAYMCYKNPFYSAK